MDENIIRHLLANAIILMDQRRWAVSSVRLGDLSALDRHQADLTSWEEVNITKLSSREKKYYTKRKSAVHDYFTSQRHIDEIAKRHHLSSRLLRRLLKRCLMRHEDGMPWGYRALLPGVTVIDHTPASIAEVTADETAVEEDGLECTNSAEPATDPPLDIAQSLSSISSSPAAIPDQEQAPLHGESSVSPFPASTDNQNSQPNGAKSDEIEDDNDDDEDTAEHEAVKMGQASAKPPVTPIPPSLLHEDEISTEEIPAEIEINDVPVEDEPGEGVRATLEVAPPQTISVEDEPGEGVRATLEVAPPQAISVEDEPGEGVRATLEVALDQAIPLEDEPDEGERATLVVALDEAPADDQAPVALDGAPVDSPQAILIEDEPGEGVRATLEVALDEVPVALDEAPVAPPQAILIEDEPVVDAGVRNASVEEETGENTDVQSVTSVEDEAAPARATLEVALDEAPVTLDQTPVTSVEDEVASVGATTVVAPDEDPVAHDAAPITSTEDEPGEGEDEEAPIAMALSAARRALIEHVPPLAPTLPYRPTSLYRTPAYKVVHTNRMVRKHWVSSVQKQRKQRRAYRIISAVVVAAMLCVILIPVGSGLAAYSAYTHIRGIALDGVNNLLAVKDLIPVSKSDPTAALNADKLHQAQNDLNQAESDFIQLQQLVNRPDIASAIQQFAPEYSNKLGMARNLVQVGLDVSRMGNELIGVALLGAGILHGSPLSSGSSKPLLTVADVSDAEGAMVHAEYYINDIKAQMSQVSINDLPVSAKQKTELASVLTLLPKAQSLITQVQGVTGIVSWLLGIGHQRRFLIQTMDNAELRPSGGFTGQYGILQIQDGRMAPFSLQDVTELDYAGNGTELYRPAPAQYRSWMTFGFWGLRDANLSGDYPTSAKLAMQVFQEEGGGPVDGDISFTPALISHILDVTGPIRVSEYHETITAKNLEDKLHYYQQDQQAIQIQRQKTGTSNAATRKAFTSLLGRILLDKVRHLSIKQLMSIMQLAVKDIQSHDLEIYFSDPQAEAWLVAHSYADSMDTFSKQDGFMVVQSNISISKASQYVHTTEQDNVTLDAQGGATHNLTITLDYKQTGPVYGYDTYADYIRVYAPPNAHLLSGDGFDSGKPLCSPASMGGGPGGTGGTPGGVPVGCSQYNTMFPSNARVCPNGNYSLGQNAYVPGKGFTFWPIDSLGAPTELTSDMPGRSMWGGLTVTPKNCISNISLSWYVPHVVRHIAGQAPYALLVQKQGGYIPTVQLTIDTSAIKGLKPFNFNGSLIADRAFSLPALKKK